MAPAPINPVYLADIYEAGGEVFAQDVADTFLTEAPRRLQALHDALTAGIWSDASLAAHAIVSGAAMLGLTEVADAARGVEHVAGDGRRPAAAEIARLETAVSAARVVLADAIADLVRRQGAT